MTDVIAVRGYAGGSHLRQPLVHQAPSASPLLPVDIHTSPLQLAEWIRPRHRSRPQLATRLQETPALPPSKHPVRRGGECVPSAGAGPTSLRPGRPACTLDGFTRQSGDLSQPTFPVPRPEGVGRISELQPEQGRPPPRRGHLGSMYGNLTGKQRVRLTIPDPQWVNGRRN